jgi:hypothetical protein
MLNFNNKNSNLLILKVKKLDLHYIIIFLDRQKLVVPQFYNFITIDSFSNPNSSAGFFLHDSFNYLFIINFIALP